MGARVDWMIDRRIGKLDWVATTPVPISASYREIQAHSSIAYDLWIHSKKNDIHRNDDQSWRFESKLFLTLLQLDLSIFLILHFPLHSSRNWAWSSIHCLLKSSCECTLPSAREIVISHVFSKSSSVHPSITSLFDLFSFLLSGNYQGTTNLRISMPMVPG